MNKIIYTTRFNSATDTKGESITVKVTALDAEGMKLMTKQKTFAYDYSYDGYDNHLEAIYSFVDDVPMLSKLKNLKRGYKFEQLDDEFPEDINFYLAL